MKLEVSPRALEQLAKAGFDPVFGARPLKRAIQRDLENPVARLILEGRFGPKDVIFNPAGRVHYFRNDGVSDAEFMLLVGTPKAEDVRFQAA